MMRGLRIFAILAVSGLGLACAGCATTDRESDLPWNMSQPWESAPTLPFGTPGSY